MLETAIQAVVNGVLVGGVYSLVSMGLTLIFGVLGIVNFAQGEFMMLGMYLALMAHELLRLDPLLASVVVFLIVGAVGAFLERLVVARVLGTTALNQIFLTVGLSIILQNVAQLVFGPDFRSVRVPYQTAALSWNGVVISVPYALAFAVSLLVTGGMWFILQRTWVGRAIRAVAQNYRAAVLMGIDPDITMSIAFGIGAGAAGLAGAVILPYVYVYPTIGLQYVVVMYTVVVLGGLGNVGGAALAGLVVGVVQSLSAALLTTDLQNLFVFLVFLATLILKPTGVLGGGSVRK